MLEASPKNMLAAYSAGMVAARRHWALRDNPYPRHYRDLWLEWRRGYLKTLVGDNENNVEQQQ